MSFDDGVDEEIESCTICGDEGVELWYLTDRFTGKEYHNICTQCRRGVDEHYINTYLSFNDSDFETDSE